MNLRWPSPAATARSLRAHWDVATLSAAAAACVAYVLLEYPSTAILGGDTLSYYDEDWYRTPGVSFLGRTLYGLTGTLYGAVVFQLVVGLGAAVFFATRWARAVQNRTLGVLLGAFLIFNANFRYLDFRLMSESVCLSGLLLAVGLALWHWQSGSILALALSSASVAVAMLFRPAAITGLVPIFLCWLARAYPSRRHALRVAALGMIPFVLIVGTWSAVNYAHYGRATPFLRGGQVLFAATLQLQDEAVLRSASPVVGRHQKLLRHLAQSKQGLDERLRAAAREPLGRAEDMRQDAMLEIFEVRGELGHLGRWVGNYFARNAKRLCPKSESRPLHLLSCEDVEQGALANAAIRVHFGEYLERVWTSWTWYLQRTHEPSFIKAGAYERYFPQARTRKWAAYRSLFLPSPLSYPVLEDPPAVLHSWQRLVQPRVQILGEQQYLWQALGKLDTALCLSVLAAFVLGTLVQSLRRRTLTLPQGDLLLVSAALYGLHAAHHLMCAAVHPAIQRYSVLMEPFAMAALLTVLLAAVHAARSGLRRAQARAA